MTALTWSGTPGNLVAVGRCGTYSVQSVGPDMHVLQGLGHDDLNISTLPYLGLGFRTQLQAMDHAERLDRTTIPEPEMSGE